MSGTSVTSTLIEKPFPRFFYDFGNSIPFRISTVVLQSLHFNTSFYHRRHEESVLILLFTDNNNNNLKKSDN